MNGRSIVSLYIIYFHPTWYPLCIEIDWCHRYKPGKLDLKDHVLKIERTRGAEVMFLEIGIASLVMNCALSKWLRPIFI